jgi:biopolymer transport protein ExbD
MRFKRHIELEHGLKQIDIAPLINVVFLLLIFFMLASSFIVQPGIKVSLPRAVTSEAVKDGNLEVVISGENLIYFNGRTVAIQDLKKLFAQAGQRNQPVLIKADKRSSLGRVVEIWDLARSLGLSQVNIATEQE